MRGVYGSLQRGGVEGVAGDVVDGAESRMVGGVAAEIYQLQCGAGEVEHRRAQLLRFVSTT